MNPTFVRHRVAATRYRASGAGLDWVRQAFARGDCFVPVWALGRVLWQIVFGRGLQIFLLRRAEIMVTYFRILFEEAPSSWYLVVSKTKSKTNPAAAGSSCFWAVTLCITSQHGVIWGRVESNGVETGGRGGRRSRPHQVIGSSGDRVIVKQRLCRRLRG
jgi:hypothetical protein